MYEIIINPASRSGRSIKYWYKAQEILNQEKIKYIPYFTKKPGHATEIAKKISELPGEHTILVFGGDGTMNEVLQGIADFENITIGYIPSGSSNDLARDLRLNSNPKKRISEIINSNNVIYKDVGEITYNSYDSNSMKIPAEKFSRTKRFSVSAGIGFDAAVCADDSMANPKKLLNKIGLGKLIYLLIALKQLFTAKREECILTIDETNAAEYKKCLFIAAMVHRYEGGGFMFCPHASCNDGLLDLCIAGSVPALKILFALPTAFFGKHFMFKELYELRGKNINIKAAVPLWVHTDGEVEVKATDISICCDKYKVKFII